jgi:uncharacterized protein YjiK
MQTRGSGVPEASGLAALGGDAFFLVDDERGIFHYAGEGRAQRLDAGGELVDLEGVALAPDGRHLCVLSERDGSVWRFQIDGASLRDGSALGRLPALSKKKNLGWEGIAYAAPGIFGPGLQLAAVHQAKPRRIGVFDPDTLEQHASLRLPKNARTTLGELNDIAVGTDGRILLLSGKRGCIANMRFAGGELSLAGIYRFETSKNDVPEGISIDAAGRVWVCTDGKGLLHEVELIRP